MNVGPQERVFSGEFILGRGGMSKLVFGKYSLESEREVEETFSVKFRDCIEVCNLSYYQ